MVWIETIPNYQCARSSPDGAYQSQSSLPRRPSKLELRMGFRLCLPMPDIYCDEKLVFKESKHIHRLETEKEEERHTSATVYPCHIV